MYLSDREMAKAIRTGRLIVDPPTKIGPTSIDLHLDSTKEARVWDIDKLREHNRDHGLRGMELRIAQINYAKMSQLYHALPPTDEKAPVFRRGEQIIVKPGGFLLWQTKEVVGTPEKSPKLICFIDGKSTRARTGLVIHLTAPTIHAGWSGKVTLEITNIAQITVAQITSVPLETMEKFGSVTRGQTDVGGKSQPRPSSCTSQTRRKRGR
jgi:dCTP deaminase